MSWVTDIILIFSLDEFLDDEDFDLEVSPALENINLWLKKNGKVMLENVSNHVYSGGKAIQACIYMGAFNYLDINDFKKVVNTQNWRIRGNVQLLIKEEQDDIFSMYMLTDDFEENL